MNRHGALQINLKTAIETEVRDRRLGRNTSTPEKTKSDLTTFIFFSSKGRKASFSGAVLEKSEFLTMKRHIFLSGFSISEFLGELIGTFILVFFGCGAVAVTVLFSAHSGLFQIAIIWGIGVSLAIYSTRHISCAHLNPAVSVAMVVGKRMKAERLPAYLGGQFLGAFIAAGLLYFLFSSSITQYEQLNHIVRGTPDSVRTAMMFGEYYPNPGFVLRPSVSMPVAFLAESIGTFALVFLIFSLTEGCNAGKPDDSLAPIFIGLSVTAIICVIAPLTQAGINPARDFSPRMLSVLMGWGRAAMPDAYGGFFVVYMLGPIFGGILASLIFVRVLEPIMKTQGDKESCCQK